MPPKITHAFQGDRVLLTAELPRESLTIDDGQSVAITLDVDDWVDLSEHAFKARQAAEREMDAGALHRRVSRVIQNAARNALHEGQEPLYATRRAVAAVQHHLADMIVAGTITGLVVQWIGELGIPEIFVRCRTRAGDLVEETVRLIADQERRP